MTTTKKKGRGTNEGEGRCREPLPGIVITGGQRGSEVRDPRISAFIWGGKVRPTPTLPYGRTQCAA